MATHPTALFTVSHLAYITHLWNDENDDSDSEDPDAELVEDGCEEESAEDSDLAYVTIADLGHIEEALCEVAFLQGMLVRTKKEEI